MKQLFVDNILLETVELLGKTFSFHLMKPHGGVTEVYSFLITAPDAVFVLLTAPTALHHV
jgi:hypothetical protein